MRNVGGRHIWGLILFILYTAVAGAENVDYPILVYESEKIFVQNQNTPSTVTFEIPNADARDFYLVIQNGFGDALSETDCRGLSLLKRVWCGLQNLVVNLRQKFERVAFAKIQLNGVELLTPQNAKVNAILFSQEITLQSFNVMALSLRGQRSAFVQFYIYSNNVPPIPDFSITSFEPNDPYSFTFDANSSFDPDGQIVLYEWIVDGLEAFSGALLNYQFLQLGTYSVQLTVTDDAGAKVSIAKDVIVEDEDAPVISVINPLEGQIFNLSTDVMVMGVSNEALSALSANGQSLNLSPDGKIFNGVYTLTSQGLNSLIFSAWDLAGNQTTVSISVFNETSFNEPPIARIESSQSSGDAPLILIFDGSSSSDPDSNEPLLYSWDFGDGSEAKSGDKVSHIYRNPGTYNVKLTVTDSKGAVGESTVVIVATAQTLPPQPQDILPDLLPEELADFSSSNRFLFESNPPVQIGVFPGVIEDKRMSVLRGRIYGENNQPLSGVKVFVPGSPGYGHTLSREDGVFDLAVNGGGALTLEYTKSGHLPAQRKVQVGWNEFSVADDVTLLPVDENVTTVSFGAEVPQIVEGSPISDSRGARQAKIFVSSNTQAQLKFRDGSVSNFQPELNLRITEFTTGDGDVSRMPAPLPDSMAYTYALDLSADEGLISGAIGVTFSQPVVLYLNDFVGSPVGAAVPIGNYDYIQQRWVGYPDGIVLKLLGVDSENRAKLDLDGDGSSDDALANDYLGISDEELIQIPQMFAVGAKLIRVTQWSFSPSDLNYAWAPNQDGSPSRLAGGPGGGGGMGNRNPNLGSPGPLRCGSIIDTENQILWEQIDLVGVPFFMNYDSSRVFGRTEKRSADYLLLESGRSLKPDQIHLRIKVAGQIHDLKFDNFVELETYKFIWDGKDAYGRNLDSMEYINTKMSYRYSVKSALLQFFGLNPPTSSQPVLQGLSIQSFSTSASTGAAPNTPPKTTWDDVLNIADRLGLDLSSIDGGGSYFEWSSEYSKLVDGEAIQRKKLGGWTPSIVHRFDETGKKLFMGDGQSLALGGKYILKKYVGTNSAGPINEGGSAFTSPLPDLQGLVRAADGTLYFNTGSRLGVITPDGIINYLTPQSSGTNNNRRFINENLSDVALGSSRPMHLSLNGFLYVYSGLRIHQVNLRTQKVNTIAGNGQNTGTIGDGLDALSVPVRFLNDIVVDQDENVYFSAQAQDRVYKISPTGTITHFAGGGTQTGDGVAARDLRLNDPIGLDILENGDLILTEFSEGIIRRVTPNQNTQIIAGNNRTNQATPSPEGVAALDVIMRPQLVATDELGQIYYAEVTPLGEILVRAINLAGSVENVVGGGLLQIADGAIGNSVSLKSAAFNILVNKPLPMPDGTILLPLSNARQIWQLIPVVPKVLGSTGRVLIPSPDGSEILEFDKSGKHLRTLFAKTGVLKWKMNYLNGGEYLSSIEDSYGLRTTFHRDSNGDLIGIEAPYGQYHSVSTNPDGLLESIALPQNSGAYRLAYTGSGGLLQSFQKPKGNKTTFIYNDEGRLIREDNAENGFLAIQSLIASPMYPNLRETSIATAENRVTTISLSQLTYTTSQVQRVGPDGSTLRTISSVTGLETLMANGVSLSEQKQADPRLGLFSTYKTFEREQSPGGVTRTIQTSRSSSLANPLDILSMTSESEISTVNGKTTTMSYLNGQRQFTVQSAEGRHLSLKINDQELPLVIQNPGQFAISMSYDSEGRATQVTQGDRSTAFTYNSSGYLEKIVDSYGKETRYTYDARGRVIEQINSDLSVIGFEYDLNGNLTGLIPQGKPIHQMEYDGLEQLKRYDPPRLSGTTTTSTSYAYNLDRQLTSIQRPDGRAINYQYGVQSGRLQQIQTAEGNYGFTPISDGRFSQVTSPYGIGLSYQFDGDFIKSETYTGPVSGLVEFTQNNDFLISSVRVNGSIGHTWTYDDENLLITAGDQIITRSPQTGFVTQTQLDAISESWIHNNFGELSAKQSSIYSINLVRDRLGRVITKTEVTSTGQTVFDYTYDTRDRLKTVSKNGVIEEVYDYDGNSNRTTINTQVVGVFDEQDRMTSFKNNSYIYNLNGDLESKTNSSTNEQTTYVYDSFGNLIQVSLPTGDQIEYIIDGNNRRVGKKRNGVKVQGFLYLDQLNPVAELNADNSVKSVFVYGVNPHVPAYMVREGVKYSIHTDHLGSVRFVVNASTGFVIQEIEYDVWGKVTKDTNPGFQPFGFAGGIYDRDTGLVRFGVRDYDPEVGRWTSKDPILFEGGDSNLYGYVLQDPVNFVDPEGKLLIPIVIITYGAFEAGFFLGATYNKFVNGVDYSKTYRDANPTMNLSENILRTSSFFLDLNTYSGIRKALDRKRSQEGNDGNSCKSN